MGTNQWPQDWNPIAGERLGPAWARIVRALADGEWKDWREIVNAGLVGSDLQTKTSENLIYSAVTLGHLQRRGRYVRRHSDTRRVRLVCAGPWAVRFGESR